MSSRAWSSYTGWDRIAERSGDWRTADDEQTGPPPELHADLVAEALIVELARPPWWRENDKARKALAEELAA